jgi:RNA ligase (TIGR02306 family)
MERKLATVQVISDISPIDGADAIEVATVKGWKVVVKKGEFNVGDKCVYCEIDSFLPIKEQFEFLRKSSYRKIGDLEGFRLRTVKLRGQVSQGLLLPSLDYEDLVYEVGEDVSELLGIIKYDPPLPAELSGVAKGNFPTFIFKTDEERIQNLSGEYDSWKNQEFFITEKLDGSSATYYLNDGVFGVCSRNLELLESESNSFWSVARTLNLEAKLKSLGFNVCLQGELIGEGIQGNSYKLKGQDVRFFNAFDIDRQQYLAMEDFMLLIERLELKTVPILNESFYLPHTIEDFLLVADGFSALNQSTVREGLVIRSLDRKISFKVISNNFLLKEK